MIIKHVGGTVLGRITSHVSITTFKDLNFSLFQALWLSPGQLSEEIENKEGALNTFKRQNSNPV